MNFFGLEIKRKKRDSITKAEHNIAMNIKNSQLKMQDAAMVRFMDMNDDLLKRLKIQNKGSTEDRIIDAITTIVTQPKSNKPHTSSTSSPRSGPLLESGVNYPEEQIRAFVHGIPPDVLITLSKLPKESFAEKVKTKIPDISETSLLKAREVVLEVTK